MPNLPKQKETNYPSRSTSRIPSFFQFPTLPGVFENLADSWNQFLSSEQTGLTISEDNKNIYVEAAIPGVQSEHIDVNLDQGVLIINAEKRDEEQDSQKKYYRKSSNSFSYRVVLPNLVDEKTEPKAVYKDGILTLTFNKTQQGQSKKISITKG